MPIFCVQVVMPKSAAIVGSAGSLHLPAGCCFPYPVTWEKSDIFVNRDIPDTANELYHLANAQIMKCCRTTGIVYPKEEKLKVKTQDIPFLQADPLILLIEYGLQEQP